MTAHGEALADEIARRDVDRDVDREQLLIQVTHMRAQITQRDKRIADLQHVIRRQAEQLAARVPAPRQAGCDHGQGWERVRPTIEGDVQ